MKVELSRDAEGTLRGLPIPLRREIGSVLDGMERGGLPPDARAEPSSPGAYRIPVRDYELLVTRAGDPEADVLLVVRISEAAVPAASEALGALPLPARIRSRLGAWLTDLGMDVRFALRTFRRRPLSVAVVVLTLAVGLGGATAIFGVVNTVFRSALPFGEGDRLVRLRNYAVTADGGERGYNMTPRDFYAIREENRVFEDVVAQRGFSLSLTGGDRAERVSAIGVTPSWAETLRVEPQMGRLFTPDEEARGGDAGVALLSYGLWQGRFGGDPEILGRQIAHDGGALTVIGVMPPRFTYPYDADLWMPWRYDRFDWRSHDLNVVARMRDGVTVEAVRADMERVYAALEEAQPEATVDTGIEVRTSRQDFIRENARVLHALLAAVGFLLLLACVNVANVLTARFVSRRREVGIRAALGAGRSRQLRQFLTETVLLFVAGGLGGLLLTMWLGDFLSVLIPDVLRTQLDLSGIRMEPAVLGFALLVSVATGLIFGATAAARGARPDLQAFLKQGARGGTGRGDRRLQDGLVVAQLALALVLLVGAGVLVDHFRELQTNDLGYETEGLYTTRITLEQERYDDPEARVGLVRALEERIGAAPEIEAVGITTVNPLCCGDWSAQIRVEGRPPPPDDAPILIHHRYVTPSYFEAMGIPILRGRNFGPADRLDGEPTVIVDEALAERFWPDGDALGQRIRWDRPDAEWRTIVGVVPRVHKEGDYTESWYLPYPQDPLGRSTPNLHLMVRARGEGAVDAVRRAVARIDPGLAVYGAAAMASHRSERLAQDRLGAVVASLFAVFGLALAAFGLYGLLSYVVELRTPEIGTRIALGANRRDVLGLVLKQALGRILLGAGAGLLLALALNRVLRSLVAGIDWAGLPLLAGLVATLVTVAALAAAVPAARAAMVDPVRAFRG